MNYVKNLLCCLTLILTVASVQAMERQPKQLNAIEVTQDSTITSPSLDALTKELQAITQQYISKINRQKELDFKLFCAASDTSWDGRCRASTLVSQGADPNGRDANDRTPLHQACTARNFETVKMLVHKDAALNAQDNSKRTPLHDTIATEHNQNNYGRVVIIKFLINSGADKYAPRNFSPLRHAVLKGDLTALKALIAAISLHNTKYMLDESILKELADLRDHFAIEHSNGRTLFAEALAMGRMDIATLVNPLGTQKLIELIKG